METKYLLALRQLPISLFILISCANSFAQAPESVSGSKWALLVGIEDYEDPHITDLQYSVDDVRIVYKVLANPRRGGFDHLMLLTSEHTDLQKRPTRVNILRGLKNWLSRVQPEDTVLFYFSGHGLADDVGGNHLMAIDTVADLPAETGISMVHVNQILNDRDLIPAKRIIVVLDACHNGIRRNAKSVIVEGKVLDPFFENEQRRITLASCGVDEMSFEDERIGHGVFTYFFAEGLKGRADVSKDGLITVSELNRYVQTQVTAWAKHRHLKQTPRRQENIAVDFVLAVDPERWRDHQQQQVDAQRQAAFRDKRETLFELMGPRTNELSPSEVATALGLLRQQAKGIRLSENDETHLLLIEELINRKIDVLFYKTALNNMAETPQNRLLAKSPLKATLETVSGIEALRLPDAQPQSEEQSTDGVKNVQADSADDYEIVGRDGVPMVLIPAGEFLMGSRGGMNDEKPVHAVYLDAYYIDKFEVSVGKYRKFVEATGYAPPDWEAIRKYAPTENCPIILISWYDAMAYAKWAGKTLPTEAQWEKAARGGRGGVDYAVGNTLSHDAANFRRLMTLGFTTGTTLPVNRYKPNPYKLYNMTGNVWEWCLDHYDSKYYRWSPKKNPLFIDTQKPNRMRVLRGGSWDNANTDHRVLRCAYRNYASPSTKDMTLGFRCVMIQEAPK